MREWKKIEGFDFKEIIFEEYNHIAKITINRERYRNAFTPLTTWEMAQAFNYCRDCLDIRVVILTGAGDKAFCAGGDMHVKGRGGYVGNDGVPRLNVLDVQMQIRRLPKPVIAMVNGYAIGGGHVLHVMCDLTIASENAIFGQPECGLGIIPGFGGTQRLARLVGMGRAKEMIFTCDNIDAAEAYRIGLVNKVVAKEELMETAKTMAAKIISKGSYAVSVAKAAINNGYDMDIKNAVEMEANLFGVVNDTHDKKEGMGAFLEKRKADLTDF